MENPTFYPSVSRYISHILDINGLRKDLRQKRRHLFLKMEVLKTTTDLLSGKRIANYHFGSQTEATTIPHFKSDVDVLYSFIDFDVKQSIEEWQEAGVSQKYRKYKLVINTDHSPPGYVRLQDVAEITPEKLAEGDLVEENGKYFYSSSNVFRILDEKETVRQGPSKADEQEHPGRLTCDRVYAYPCRTWPTKLWGWVNRRKEYGWPSNDLVLLSMSKGCFLVPVGNKLSQSSDIEWRLSPSLAERILMFSLNETHVKCYVLLKHIVKYILKPQLGPGLTSFHCKTAVLTLAERTPWEIWTPDRLLECMDICLRQIITWCRAGWCPNYFLPAENLFAGRMNMCKQQSLLEILLAVYSSHWKILMNVDDWGLGNTLRMALTGCPYLLSCRIEEESRTSVSNVEGASRLKHFESILKTTQKVMESFINIQWPVECAVNILQILIDADDENEEVCFRKLLKVWQSLLDDKERLNETIIQEVLVTIIPIICLQIGSVISSLPGRRGNNFWWSEVFTEWIQPCFKQYRIVGSLKLATILISRGEEYDRLLKFASQQLRKFDELPEDETDPNLLNQLLLCHKLIEEDNSEDDFRLAECILDHIESEYLESIVPLCPCRLGCQNYYRKSGTGLEDQQNFACCVLFMRGEMKVVPYPLQFEFFRSSPADRELRDPYKDKWMDLVAIDAVVYLYFLQYECYRHLKHLDQKRKALMKLQRCIEDNEVEIFHIETALNVLGYCLLLENRLDDALQIYSTSLQIQPTNNCATWHIALIINKFLHAHNCQSALY